MYFADLKIGQEFVFNASKVKQVYIYEGFSQYTSLSSGRLFKGLKGSMLVTLVTSKPKIFNNPMLVKQFLNRKNRFY